MIEQSIAECVGFDWDQGNASKNLHKHQVSIQEAEEVFFNSPLILATDAKHSGNESRFYALGKTDEEKPL